MIRILLVAALNRTIPSSNEHCEMLTSVFKATTSYKLFVQIEIDRRYRSRSQRPTDTSDHQHHHRRQHHHRHHIRQRLRPRRLSMDQFRKEFLTMSDQKHRTPGNTFERPPTFSPRSPESTTKVVHGFRSDMHNNLQRNMRRNPVTTSTLS